MVTEGCEWRWRWPCAPCRIGHATIYTIHSRIQAAVCRAAVESEARIWQGDAAGCNKLDVETWVGSALPVGSCQHHQDTEDYRRPHDKIHVMRVDLIAAVAAATVGFGRLCSTHRSGSPSRRSVRPGSGNLIQIQGQENEL